MSTNPPSIFGFWRTIWNCRHGDVEDRTFLCEYAESGHFTQENVLLENRLMRRKVRCDYAPGRVKHIYHDGSFSEYTYRFEGDVLIMTNSIGLVWKLVRGTDTKERLKAWEVIEKEA